MINELSEYLKKNDCGEDVYEDIYNQKKVLDKYKFLVAYHNFKNTLKEECNNINDNNFYVKIGMDNTTDVCILKVNILCKDESNTYIGIKESLNASVQLIAAESTLISKANYLYSIEQPPYFNQTGKNIIFNLSPRSDIDKLDKFLLEKSMLALYNSAVLEMNLSNSEIKPSFKKPKI